MTKNQRLMLLDWMRKIHQMEYAHRTESIIWSRVHFWVGLSAFILATSIAVSYKLPEVSKETYDSIFLFLKKDIFIGVAAIFISLLTGLQTFLKANERSEKHRSLSREFEELRHEVESILNSNNGNFDEGEKKIREQWKLFDSLNVSNQSFRKAKKTVKSFNKYPDELGFIENQ
jgi:uncharacterized protein HemY